GVGVKVGMSMTYDTKWISTTAQKIQNEADTPGSDLNRALADADSATLPVVQKASVVAAATASELADVAQTQGKFFGDPVKKVGEVVGLGAKLTDERTGIGAKVEAAAVFGVQKLIGTERVNVGEVWAKVKDENATVGDKVGAIG